MADAARAAARRITLLNAEIERHRAAMSVLVDEKTAVIVQAIEDGATQAELAVRLGISRQRINALLANTRTVNPRVGWLSDPPQATRLCYRCAQRRPVDQFKPVGVVCLPCQTLGRHVDGLLYR